MMKSVRNLLAVSVATCAILAMGIGATGAGAETPGGVVAGTYNMYVDGVATSTITINADNTWAWNGFCDGGAWGTIGGTLALDDSACGLTVLPDGGAFIVHTNMQDHLGTKADPGTLDAGATVDSWYGTPAIGSASHLAASTASALAGAHGSTLRADAVSPGTFNFSVNEVPYTTISLNSDNTWQIDNGNCDGGSWVELNTVVALSDSSCYGQLPDGGIWMATTTAKSGMGTAKKPGFADDPYAVTFSWFATPSS